MSFDVSVMTDYAYILQGEYGLKRFLRDGYGTSVEPKDRRHYDRSILKVCVPIQCNPFFKAPFT